MASITFKGCFSEFIGTFGIVLFGQWLIILAFSRKIDLIAVALGFAAIISTFTMTASKDGYSHFNPSVTIGFFAARKLSLLQTIFFLISQFIGALLGYLICSHTVPAMLNGFSEKYQRMANYGMPIFSSEIGNITIYLFEFIGTMILTSFISALHASKKLHSYAPIVGAIYGLSIITFGNFHSICLNPLRFLTPALFQTNFNGIAAFTIPSLVGGAVGGLIGNSLFQAQEFNQLTDEIKNE